jgi:phosphatidylglycerophosphate synthase
MLDRFMRRLIDPVLARLAHPIVAAAVSADALSLTGFLFGLAAAWLIAAGLPHLALAPLVFSRLCDGLDGAVARQTRPSDRGGFLDIVFDFIFYGAVPLAFALSNPAANALAAASLLFAFYANGSSFLAYAAMAAKRGLVESAPGAKSLYFSIGLTEGTETIALFIAFCVFPDRFAPLAFVFAGLCLISTLARIRLAWRDFR